MPNTYPTIPAGIDTSTSMHPSAIAWRRMCAKANNAIEDCPTDPGADALRDQLDAEGVTGEDRIERMSAYLISRGTGLKALRAECEALGLPQGLSDSYARAYFKAGPPAKTLAELVALIEGGAL
jgi:hypothetical protein